MSNIKMILSLHDNDFWVDMHFLGEFVTSIMRFFESYKLDQSMFDNDQYRASLKCALIDLLTSIYKLRLLISQDTTLTVPFNLTDYTNNVEHISNWFKCQFDLYFIDDEFNKAIELIDTGSLSKRWNDIRYFDEFQVCNGNYEFLIIHCCSWETKFVLV